MIDQQNILLLDLRPAKRDMHAALTDYGVGRTSYECAVQLLKTSADSIPDLFSDNFIKHVSRLMLANNTDRAHRLVDALADFTLRPGILWTLKWGTIFGIVATVVWLIAGIGR